MLPNLPFTIVRGPDRVVITLHRDAGQHHELINEDSYTWIQPLTGRVELDFADLPQVNSLLVAWLFQLVQVGRLSDVVIRRASALVVSQLKQFYLDRFVTITYDGV